MFKFIKALLTFRKRKEMESALKKRFYEFDLVQVLDIALDWGDFVKRGSKGVYRPSISEIQLMNSLIDQYIFHLDVIDKWAKEDYVLCETGVFVRHAIPELDTLTTKTLQVLGQFTENKIRPLTDLEKAYREEKTCIYYDLKFSVGLDEFVLWSEVQQQQFISALNTLKATAIAQHVDLVGSNVVPCVYSINSVRKIGSLIPSATASHNGKVWVGVKNSEGKYLAVDINDCYVLDVDIIDALSTWCGIAGNVETQLKQSYVYGVVKSLCDEYHTQATVKTMSPKLLKRRGVK